MRASSGGLYRARFYQSRGVQVGKTLLVLGALALLAAACSCGPGSGPTSLPQPTVVSLTVAGRRTGVRFAVMDVEVPVYEGVIVAFEKDSLDLG